MAKITDLKDILEKEGRVIDIIKAEHIQLDEKYGDARRTEIGEAVGSMEYEDLIPNEQVAVLFSQKGFVKRMPITLFRSQRRGGRGVNSMTTRDTDVINRMHVNSTHDFLLCFSSTGRVFKIKVYQIPEASKQGKGVSIAHFLNLDEGETITASIATSDFSANEYLFMTTEKGIIKKTAIDAFIHFKNKPIIAINLDDGDSLKWVSKTTGDRDLILITSAGMAIRFNEDQARPLGRSSRGVRGIKVKSEDSLVAVGIIDPEDEKSHLLVITKYGYGKKHKSVRI